MANRGKLSSSQLPNQLNRFVEANTVIEYYVQSVIQQSNIKLSALKNLPAHQDLARKHAQYWRDDIAPEIQQSVTDTIHFSEAFLGKYDALRSLIDQMVRGDQKAKEEFTTAIYALIENLAIVSGHTKDVATQIVEFSSRLDQDTGNFKLDSEEAQKRMTVNSGELKALLDQLNAINKNIVHDRAIIAGGVITFWLVSAARIDLKKQEIAEKDVELKLAMDKQELMALNAAKFQIDGFVNSMVPVSSASKTLEEGWASLKSDFEEVITELKRLSVTDAAFFLGPLLDTAKKHWISALDNATQLKPKS